MGRTSPQGLTAHDFHHPPCVNPRDVFPGRSRLANRAHGFRSALSHQPSSRSPSRFSAEGYKFSCCGEEGASSFRPQAVLDCCSTDRAADGDQINHHLRGPGVKSNCCTEAARVNRIETTCVDCFEDCQDCADEHQECNPMQSPCVAECEECLDEHNAICNSKGLPCGDTCDECDFSCFDCIDWNPFEKDKSLGLSFSVPLLEDSETPASSTAGYNVNETDGSTFHQPQSPEFSTVPSDSVAPPLDVPMHHQCYGDMTPFWSSMAAAQQCHGNLRLMEPFDQLPSSLPTAQPPAGLPFGCHPAAAHQQGFAVLQPLPAYGGPNSLALVPTADGMLATHSSPHQAASAPISTQDLLFAVTSSSTAKACQWLMPCGTTCGASFATATDLKKHLKAIHLVKGTVKCSWQECGAVFASEAALTGHVSKKHIAADNDDGPFKCTVAGCSKSFMYKQVRDDHVASCHNGNKVYCHICDQFLNGEGSNFKRHMANHLPKHQHMLCKYHHLGCKKRFPRLDNLRRHEACCKFGKKAASGAGFGAGAGADAGIKHHHHHHRHSIHKPQNV